MTEEIPLPPEDWKQCWQTPPKVFNDLIVPHAKRRWGVDAADCVDTFASKKNSLARLYWDREQDALAQDWDEKDWWYFANPPFKLLRKVLPYATEQVRLHRAKVVLLFQWRDLQAGYIRETAAWWDKYVLVPRLGYIDPRTGLQEMSPPAASTIWVSRQSASRTSSVSFAYLLLANEEERVKGEET